MPVRIPCSLAQPLRPAAAALVVAALVFAGWSPWSAGGARSALAVPAAGKVIVVVRDDVDPHDVARTHGLRARLTFRHAVHGFSTRASEEVLAELARDPNVTAISADEPMHAAAQTPPTGVRRIGAASASATGAGMVVDADVAVLDSGIDPTHPDLNVAGGVDCTGTGSWVDDNGHGTHVAGTIGARDNGDGVVGVAPGARLWSVKVLDSTRYGL